MNDFTKEIILSEFFHYRLRTARELRKLTQSELAIKTKMPSTSISHFESGSRKPSCDNLCRLANGLKVTTDFLLARADDPEVSDSIDPLFRHLGQLSASDRELAMDFIKMLSER